MTKKMKITIIATVIIIIFTIICSFNSMIASGEKAEVTLYSLDKRTISVSTQDVDAYLQVGWYTEPVMTVYSLDNRSLVIAESQFYDYHAVGWYSEPVVELYSPKGGKEIVAQKEIGYYKSIGYRVEQQVNEAEVVLLARVIYAEATENPTLRILDRQYVGAVVMNRVRHPRFPNTLSGVVYAKGQYACVGNYKFNSYPPQECLDIARQLLQGESFGVPSNVVFQAQFHQGRGLWKKVGVHYYCYI